MSRAKVEPDVGLQRAIAAAGGRRQLSRALGIRQFQRWRRIPQSQLFKTAQVTGIPPEQLRPDLADWIAQELERRRLAESDGGLTLQDLAASLEDRWDGPVIDTGLTDLWASFAAVMFVAGERRMKVATVCYSADPAAQEARTYAMALAHVAGRASSTNVANVFGCSRQNVDNATERYLRARDGDDPEDHIKGQFEDGRPRVMELGSNRLRLAKTADPKLWAAEGRFEKFLRGEDLAAPQPERKRA